MPQGQDRLSLPKKSGLGSRAPGQRLQARALRIVVGAHGSWMTATRLRGATAKPAATNGTLRQQQRGRSTDAAPHESQHALSAHRRCKRCKLAMSTRSATTISPTTNAGVPSKCRPFASARTAHFICDGRILHSRLSCSTSRPTRAAILRVTLQLGEIIRARWNSSNFPCFLEASAAKAGNWESGPRTGNCLITSFRLGSCLKAFW